MQYWRLIEQIVAQVLLDGKGMDPNFQGRYKIKVDDIIKGFVEKDKFHQMEADVKDARLKYDQALRDKDKLDNEWADTFDRMKADLNKKIAELDETIRQLKATGGGVGGGVRNTLFPWE